MPTLNLSTATTRKLLAHLDATIALQTGWVGEAVTELREALAVPDDKS